MNENISAMERILRAREAQSAEGLAKEIEPLAQAMASLAEDAAAKIEEVEQKTTASLDQFREKYDDLWDAANRVDTAAAKITDGVSQMKAARKTISIKILILALFLGLMIGTAAGAGSWHLLKGYYIKSKVLSMWPENQEYQEKVLKGML